MSEQLHTKAFSSANQPGFTSGPGYLSDIRRWKVIIHIAWPVAMVASSFLYLQISITDLMQSLPGFIGFFLTEFLPPNYRNLLSYIPYIIDTILFAVVGTYISSILAFLFGLMMSYRHSPVPWLRPVFIAASSLFRNVPFLIWATVLIFIFGIGSMVGLTAIAIMTLGFLSRSYATSLDEIVDGKLDGLRAAGASQWQILIHGIIPEFLPAWLNWTLFTFEINIRASAILGMVGAGGIGIMIRTNIRLFKYHESFSLILVLIVIILSTELGTGWLRRQIR